MTNHSTFTRMSDIRLRPDRSAWGGFRHIRTAWLSPPPLPSLEDAVARMRSRPGFLASLTPEQWTAISGYDGPEILGDPDGPRRTF